MSATSTPSSPSRSASHGPLRSLTRPLSSSVPVTTMPARTVIGASWASRAPVRDPRHALATDVVRRTTARDDLARLVVDPQPKGTAAEAREVEAEPAAVERPRLCPRRQRLRVDEGLAAAHQADLRAVDYVKA